MPNPNSPRGLIPYAYSEGGMYNGAVTTYYVPAGNATALFIGDPVVGLTNSSDGNGIPAVGIATAGGGTSILGSIQGVSNNAGGNVIPVLQNQPVYLPAGQAAYVYVADDPDLLFWIQENGAMVSGAGGRNADLVAGTGNTITGYSGWQLNSSTLNTTATLQMRIRRMLAEPADNMIGTNAKWLCRINLHSINNPLGV